MVQIKPYFLGLAVPPSPRLASCQKCFRTTDIESVGDAKHLTFFEMLGNFSVGDYFKREAIGWALDYIEGEVSLPRERLWATVYNDDDEAFDIWRRQGFSSDRVVRLGEKDNFWGPAGDSGPCGPCSEIHFDFGSDKGCGRADCNPGCSCGRFIEIWNLVFTQYDQDTSGKRVPLPRPNIDTGMGLERIVAVVGGQSSVYQTDLFTPLLEAVSTLAGSKYGDDTARDQAMRVVAEHARSLTFLIADGVLPSNEGRGYVLRRVLRRASLFGRKLGLQEPFLGNVSRVVISRMGKVYPELVNNQKFINEVIQLEEERFYATLDTGLALFDRLSIDAKARGVKTISGTDVFRLYDTYGFPMEVTREVARDQGFEVDVVGFAREMEQQRARARASRQTVDIERDFKGDFAASLGIAPVAFIGYESTDATTEIVWIQTDGKTVAEARPGQGVEVILRETPFYGEKGGQVGDTGEIITASGRVEVTNSIHDARGLIIHKGNVVSGTFALGTAQAKVDQPRRLDIMRNHTATHLLQAALKEIVGNHVAQRGSMVSPDRLRFDFSQLQALTPAQLTEVQRWVNTSIRSNFRVNTEVVSYTQAIKEGATAIFEEKYGDTVRQVKVGFPSISHELCGGTHVRSTGDIGMFIITSETSIGSGLRRIEAVTGRGAEMLVELQTQVVRALSHEFKAPPEEIRNKVGSLAAELMEERRKAKVLANELMRRDIDKVLAHAEEIKGVKVLVTMVEASSMIELREMGDLLRERLKNGIVVLAAVCAGKPSFIAMVTADLVIKGHNAGSIVREAAKLTGGGGGGKPDIAQAGGKDISKLSDALDAARRMVRTVIEGQN
jgi:alanyl-tRNA synthetase